MHTLNRRCFLASAAGALSGSARDLLAAAPDLQFPTLPRDRLAVASYPFRAFIESPENPSRDPQKPGMDLKYFAAMVVSRFHVRNIEPLGQHFASTDSEYLSELRSAVENAGSRIVNIPVSVGASLYDPDPALRERAVGNSKLWIDVAVAVGSPSVRVHVQRSENSGPDVERAAVSLKTVAAHGAQRNVIVNLENDDLVSEDAFFLVKVIEKVNSPFLHALPDFCNSMLSGDERFNYEAITIMFRHAYNISHMKDSEVGRNKIFRVNVGRTFAVAKAAKYRGYFSMEWEGGPDPYAGTQKLIDESLRYLQA